jgi:hypothetical protein
VRGRGALTGLRASLRCPDAVGIVAIPLRNWTLARPGSLGRLFSERANGAHKKAPPSEAGQSRGNKDAERGTPGPMTVALRAICVTNETIMSM